MVEELGSCSCFRVILCQQLTALLRAENNEAKNYHLSHTIFIVICFAWESSTRQNFLDHRRRFTDDRVNFAKLFVHALYDFLSVCT